MYVYSFVQNQHELEKIEVEVALMRGLPEIKILGMPDQCIKESVQRIRSAFSSQGFSLPTTQQIMINLRPANVKKVSRGLDLAIAMSILSLTNQIEIIPAQLQGQTIYGEIHLDGSVHVPDDLGLNLVFLNIKKIILGRCEQVPSIKYKTIDELKNINKSSWQEGSPHKFNLKRPEIKDIQFSLEQAKVIKIIAIGEHSALLAGPAGSGKTTLLDIINPLLDEPDEKLFLESLRISKYFSRQDFFWRPVFIPHHSATAISILGGGVPPKPGVITRAHGGVLILDELLEFEESVQSALREPIERGYINLSKSYLNKTFPANFLLLATTNLCPCGNYIPNQYNKCRCSSHKLRKYLEKLSGPFLDRFQIFILTRDWQKNPKTVSAQHLWQELVKIRDWVSSQNRKTKKNGYLSWKEIEGDVEDRNDVLLLPEGCSERRKLATLRVAKTLADMELCPKIQLRHLREALDFTYQNYFAVSQVPF